MLIRDYGAYGAAAMQYIAKTGGEVNTIGKAPPTLKAGTIQGILESQARIPDLRPDYGPEMSAGGGGKMALPLAIGAGAIALLLLFKA